nr:MAG TPA: hypothetical protein [Caudoviricetes sp.]
MVLSIQSLPTSIQHTNAFMAAYYFAVNNT